MPCHTWPSGGCYDSYNTSRAPSLEQIPFIELSGQFPGINISFQIFHLRAILWSLITLNNSADLTWCFPSIHVQTGIHNFLHPADVSVSEISILGWCCWMYLLFQRYFRSCLIPAPSAKFLFLLIFYCFQLEENICSKESESCEKTPSRTMDSSGKPLCLSFTAKYCSRAQMKMTCIKHFAVDIWAWTFNKV